MASYSAIKQSKQLILTTDESHDNFAGWKSLKKMSIYCLILPKHNCRRHKLLYSDRHWWLLGMADQKLRITRSKRKQQRRDQFVILTVMISWVYTYMQFTVRRLYLHKALDLKWYGRS